MRNPTPPSALSHSPIGRRDFLLRTAFGAAVCAVPDWAFLLANDGSPAIQRPPMGPLLALLTTWCDGLLTLQVNTPQDPRSDGGLRCPACGFIHGRSADAAYPLLALADATGQRKYADAAIRLQNWADNVTASDGSWLCEFTSKWKGTTVFGAIALAMILKHHRALLDETTRNRWAERLARAMRFLDEFLTMETGNINYPVTGALTYALAGQVLDNRRWIERGHKLAHDSLGYFTANHFLYGEGKPPVASPKGYRSVDLGYNVEESLPNLAQYAILTGDAEVLQCAVEALRTHAEFMLPDGAWDNSWGTRNFKWSWWGSRTSDGCLPGYLLLAKQEPRFAEVAWRNFELLAACTHDGLLYGGPDCHRCGYLPCSHHTLMHAKALATVLDSPHADVRPPRTALPREAATYDLRHYPEIGTTLVASGDWRATVTDSDWEYDDTPGGHASGGALSLLYHLGLGPILVAGMTEYRLVEKDNQQKHLSDATMPLGPRLQCIIGATAYTNLSDYQAVVTRERKQGQTLIHVSGHLRDIHQKTPSSGEIPFTLSYRFTPRSVRISAEVSSADNEPIRLILPVVCPREDTIRHPDTQTVQIEKRGGTLCVQTDATSGFEKELHERVFNLVPGFECAPLSLTLPRSPATASIVLSFA